MIIASIILIGTKGSKGTQPQLKSHQQKLKDKWVRPLHGLGVSGSEKKNLMGPPVEYSLATKCTKLLNVCGPGRKAPSQSVPTWYIQSETCSRISKNIFTFQGGPSEDKKL